jgi:hypothetical protein
VRTSVGATVVLHISMHASLAARGNAQPQMSSGAMHKCSGPRAGRTSQDRSAKSGYRFQRGVAAPGEARGGSGVRGR